MLLAKLSSGGPMPLAGDRRRPRSSPTASCLTVGLAAAVRPAPGGRSQVLAKLMAKFAAKFWVRAQFAAKLMAEFR